MKHILLVEHDIFLQDMYCHMLRSEYRVSPVRSAQDCIDILDSETVDLVISDIQVGFNNGVEVLHELRSYDDWIDIPLIVLSSVPKTSFPPRIAWERYGVHAFLYKPHLTDKRLHMAIASTLASQLQKA